MIHLIPAVKELQTAQGTLAKKSVCFDQSKYSERLQKALGKLPVSADGARLEITLGGATGEGYSLTVTPIKIKIDAESERGAFYAIQTLRQLFENEEIPCLTINDAPDFSYRGFYHDVTRGKVPTLDTLKKLIDNMAYYKLNVLQLYVEHVFPFEECRDLIKETSCLTGEELRELDQYCTDNFIDFRPSLSTFGHLFELLQQEKYSHLRTLKSFKPNACRWRDRMAHHTVDPTLPESLDLSKSLIDQYAPHFTSEYFNVCCDETFDLARTYPGQSSKLYVDFVKKIVAHVKDKGKIPMMWADILLQHPECITEIPEDVYFLNWNYASAPKEATVQKLASLGRRQIVCPGTSSWSRFCETVDTEEKNICLMAEYGYKHGAVGVLNTNWGDWGNPASLETSYYGMVLGAAKSWNIATAPSDEFDADVNALLYHNQNGMRYLRRISRAHAGVGWNLIMKAAHYHRAGLAYDPPMTEEGLKEAQQTYRALARELVEDPWQNGDFKTEFLLAAEGVCALAELGARLAGLAVERITSAPTFLSRYRERWLAKNKPSELARIEDIFLYMENL